MAKVRGSADIASARVTPQVATAPSPDIFKEEFAAKGELAKAAGDVGVLLTASDDLTKGTAASREAMTVLQDFNAKMEADRSISGSDYAGMFDAEVDRVSKEAQGQLSAGAFDRFTKVFNTTGMRQTVVNSGSVKVAKDGVTLFNTTMTADGEVLSDYRNWINNPALIQSTLLNMSGVAQTTIDGGFAKEEDVNKNLRDAKNKGLALAVSGALDDNVDPIEARDRFNETGKTGIKELDDLLDTLSEKDIEAIESQVSGFTQEERSAQLRREERDKVLATSEATTLRTKTLESLSKPEVASDPVARTAELNLVKDKHRKMIAAEQMTGAQAEAFEKELELKSTSEAIARFITGQGKGAETALRRLIIEGDTGDPQLTHLYRSKIFANTSDKAALIRDIGAIIGQPEAADMANMSDALLGHFDSTKDAQASAENFVRTGRTGDANLDAQLSDMRPDQVRALRNTVGDGVSERIAQQKADRQEHHQDALSDADEFAAGIIKEYSAVQPPFEGGTLKVQIAKDAERTDEIFTEVKRRYDALVNSKVGYTQKMADAAFKTFKTDYIQDAISEHFNALPARELKARHDAFVTDGVTGDDTLNTLYAQLSPDDKHATQAEVGQPVQQKVSVGQSKMTESLGALSLTVTLNNVGEKTAEAAAILKASTDNVAIQNSELIKFKQGAGERIVATMQDAGLYKPALNKLLRDTPLSQLFTASKRNELKKQLRTQIKNAATEARINSTVTQTRTIADLSKRVTSVEDPLTFEELSVMEADARAKGAPETYINQFADLKKQLLQRFNMSETDLRDDDAPVEILKRLREFGSVTKTETGEVKEFKLKNKETEVTNLLRLQHDINKMRAQGKISPTFYKSVTEQIMENRLTQVERERDGMFVANVVGDEPYSKLLTEIDNMISNAGGGTGAENDPLRAQMYDVGITLMDKLLATGTPGDEKEKAIARNAVIKQINANYVNIVTGGNKELVEAAQNANSLRFSNGRIIKLMDASSAGIEALVDVKVLGDSVVAQSFVDDVTGERYVANVLRGSKLRVSPLIPVSKAK